jgi:excisionase family DNA binding protein
MSDCDMSLGKIAKLCNVSRTTVYRWIVNGHLKAYSLPSGHFRVRRSDLEAFRESFNIPDEVVREREERVRQVIRDQHSASEGAGPIGENNPLRVLIADDHEDMVLVLRKVVERFLPQAEIFEAINGVDTCVSVGTVRPHLLLLDLMMPGMDGFAVLQELLRRPELSDSKVVIVSAYEPFDRVREIGSLNPQVVHCVPKPISVQDLGDKLKEIVQGLPVAGA